MSGWYNAAKARGLDVLVTETIKVMLVTDAYVFDPDDEFIGSSAGSPGYEEFAGTGYEFGFNGAGRLVLTSKSVSVDNAFNRSEFHAADVTWTGITSDTAYAAILIQEVTDDDDSLLVAYIDSGGWPITPAGRDLKIEWSDDGILHVT